MALAWPIMLSRASQTVVGLSDVWLIAPLGSQALAATSTGALNSFVMLILPFGTVFIVQSFCAQYFGRGDAVSARRYGWYGLGLAVLTQVVILISLPHIDSALGLLDYEPEVRRLMATYLYWRLLSGGAAIGIEALNGYFGGLGRTRPGMVANVVAMTLNVPLNVLLIEGAGPIPALGVMGSALASSMATWCGFIGLFVYFLRDGRGLPTPKLAWAEFGRMLRFGIGSGLNYTFEFMAYTLFVNVVVKALGTSALAAWNTVININSVAFMPAFGLASAGAVLVGQSIGARRPEDVPRVVRLTLIAAASWQGLVGLVCLVVPQLVLAPFAKGAGAAEMIALGSGMLMVSAAWQLFDATAMSYAEALRGAGDTIFPMVARLIIAWTVFVPGAWYSVHFLHWSALGAASWMVLYLALLSVVMVWRFRSGAWKRVTLVEPDLVGSVVATH